MSPNQRQRIANAFNRAAHHYDVAAQMQQRYAIDLIEQAAKLTQAATVCDAGCGTGYNFKTIRQCFPQANLIGLDCANAMLQLAKTRIAPEGAVLQAVLEALPLAPECLDVLFCHFTLQWCDDIRQVLEQFHNVLKPHALLSLATFGDKSLHELATATHAVTGVSGVNRFLSHTQLMQTLQDSGFVIEAQRINVETLYVSAVLQLMQFLKAMGANTVLHHHWQGLGGKTRLRAYQLAYQPFANEQGKLPATFEIVLITARKK